VAGRFGLSPLAARRLHAVLGTVGKEESQTRMKHPLIATLIARLKQVYGDSHVPYGTSDEEEDGTGFRILGIDATFSVICTEDTPVLSENSIRWGIGFMSQNRRIIGDDDCYSPNACLVRWRPVQVAPGARS
jgi:hypothetical protein